MVQTYGLTHIALKVKNPERSLLFYHEVFGVRVMYQKEDFIQVQTPDARDIIVFVKANDIRHNDYSIIHFGFRLQNPGDIGMLIQDVTRAGGQIKEKGEFEPGEPYVYIFDPDGYEIEVWYEKITPELSSFN
jgi:catechol 2,3-dioxygenase-like lactoylglutathione lyase family enzyme